ncbi:MAG: tRNA (cytidine(34)-2'-O)-methyltransferase [Erysipelotrichales bacterium]|nr:tRNA (cytidine(34)-2'-O)-methyltransferase [Erysipelotrichales bacterium]
MINVILYQPEIAQNTGNIMRTCAAFGAKLHIIGPIPFSINDEGLHRSGMEYISNVDYYMYDDYDDFCKKISNKTIFYVTRYGKKSPDKFDFSDVSNDYYIMFGRESTGIPKEILGKNYDNCIRIPMKPFARSLNLANSVAIVMYELIRQQNYFDLATEDNLKDKHHIK